MWRCSSAVLLRQKPVPTADMVCLESIEVTGVLGEQRIDGVRRRLAAPLASVPDAVTRVAAPGDPRAPTPPRPKVKRVPLAAATDAADFPEADVSCQKCATREQSRRRQADRTGCSRRRRCGTSAPRRARAATAILIWRGVVQNLQVCDAPTGGRPRRPALPEARDYHHGESLV